MIATIRTFLLALMTILIGTGLASADQRAVYTITDIEVDARAETAREAEQRAFTEAKVKGLRRLVAKLTLDGGSTAGLSYDAATANYLSAAVDVLSEQRSANRYRGELSVVFIPSRVTQWLDQARVRYVDTQSEPSLLVPTAGATFGSNADAWRRAWPDANRGSLTPYIKGLALYDDAAGWGEVSSETTAVGARIAIRADLIGAPGAYGVRLTRLSPSGTTTIGTTGSVATLEDAVAAATAYLELDHKRASIVTSNVRTSKTATVLFSNIQEWNRMRSGLLNSPLVSDFWIDGVSRDGALISFTYAGEQSRLESDMARRGMSLDAGRDGWVIRTGR